MDLFATFDELQKLGAVTDEQAQAAVDRLETLERNKATPERVARYATVGAVAAPAIVGIGNAIKGKGFRAGLSGMAHLRDVAGDSAKGALGAGALPLVQQHFDRVGEEGKLRKYLAEE